MSSITQRALEAMPGYGENAIIRALRAEASVNRAPALATDEDILQRIIDLGRSGEPIPYDIAEPLVVDFERHQRILNARRPTINRAIDRLKNDSSTVVAQYADRALAVLHDELTRLVTEVKAAGASLKGAATAEDAIRRGPAGVTAYERVSELVADYDEIRFAQARILKECDNGDTLHVAPMRHYGLFADSIDVLPYWAEQRVNAFDNTKKAEPSAAGYKEWLNEAHGPYSHFTWDEAQRLEKGWWPAVSPAERIAHLVWVATATTAWVPSVKHLRAANLLAAEAIVPLTTGTPTRLNDATRALAALCELTRMPYPEAVPTPVSDKSLKVQQQGNDPSQAPKFDTKGYLAQRLTDLY